MKYLRFVLVVGLVFAGATMLLPGKASAFSQCNGTIHWTRQNCHGFYTNQTASSATGVGDVVIPAGIQADNSTQYIALMKKYLFNGNLQEKTGASFTISIMMNRGPSFYGGVAANGISWAQANFDQWATVIQYYDNHGLVDWHYAFSSVTPYEDSGYGLKIHDNYYITYEGTTADSIRFRMPPGYNGKPFMIDHSCANVQGADNGLPYPPTTPPPGTPPPSNPPPGTPPPPPGTPPPTTPPPASNPPTGDINKPTGNPPGFNTGDSALYSSCQVISGHAFDPRTPNKGIKVTISFSTGGPPVTATSGNTGTHLFTANTPDTVRNSLSSVSVTAKATDSTGADFTLTNSPITIGPCVVIAATCGNASTIPEVPDPSANYSIRASVKYGTSADAATALSQPDFKFFLRVTGPDGPTVVYNNANVPGAKRSGNQISVQIDNLPPTGKTGTYLIGWGVTGTYGMANCGSSIPGNKTPPGFSSRNKPYFTVNGGDVSVGAAMTPVSGSNCSVSQNEKASIVSWNANPTGGDYRGAGVQYAAFALNHIQEFATAHGQQQNPTEPSGLGFANNGLQPVDINATTGLYGGKLQGSGCVPNYYINANASNTTSGPVRLSALKDFPSGGSIPNGARLIYYIDGNLLVDSNVRFSTAYNSADDIPTFSVIVKGNIYVQPGVQQLDGFYIAQPATANSTDGIIYTCAPQDFNTNATNVLKNTLQEACKTPLTVNGAYVARQIWLLRTAGTVTTGPAEVFNYVPELWIGKPLESGVDDDLGNYDAIVSLPPIL